MSWFARKILLVLGALAIAAGITVAPWIVLFNYDGEANQLFGFTAILWAPLALVVGLVVGAVFAFAFWPRER